MKTTAEEFSNYKFGIFEFVIVLSEKCTRIYEFSGHSRITLELNYAIFIYPWGNNSYFLLSFLYQNYFCFALVSTTIHAFIDT